MTEINPEIKGAIETIIFISEGPIPTTEIQNVLEGLDLQTIKMTVEELKKDYEQRNSAIKIVEVAGGYQMVTSPNYAHFIKKFYKIKHSEKLTMPSLETLSIIAYKQPVTKVEIESIRGVNVDGVIKNLLEKSLIRIVGRKEVVGRPFVYGTTRSFLEYFGLNSLDELPDVEEFVQTLQDRETAEITPLKEEELDNIQPKVEDRPPFDETPVETQTDKKETTETTEIKKET
ncbi:MAG: SMC-Scp complex subunit ScpB [Candidatus Omnitrophica bacterium]|nr:SMC-Scp complex subunit ScpB [Candidatus Omnitrophota bacterium]